jgi:hypothetical protein
MEYSFCNYTINNLSDTEIIIEIKKYTNYNDLNGTYQYFSSHLFSAEGIINDNKYGDQSIFRINNEDDYGAEFNYEGIYYYHLWFTKDLYLIHITSKGDIDVKEYIEEIALKINFRYN